MKENIVSTSTRERCVTSYAARTQYRPGEIHPPHVKVRDAIDIHCHAHEGQQNPFDLAKRASQAEMKGLLFKSIFGEDPAESVREVQEEANRWAEKERIEPVGCWAGFVCGRQTTPVSAKIRRHRHLAPGLHPCQHAEYRRNLSPAGRRGQCGRVGGSATLG